MADNPYGLKKVEQKKKKKLTGKQKQQESRNKNKLRIKKLQEINKKTSYTANSGRYKTDSRGRKKYIKGMGNMNRKDALHSSNMKGKGMSGLGADYGKQEEKLQKDVVKHRKSKEYKENIAKHNERLRNKGKKTTGGTESKTTSETKKVSRKGTHVMNKYIRHNGKIIRRNSRAGRELEKKLKIRKSK